MKMFSKFLFKICTIKIFKRISRTTKLLLNLKLYNENILISLYRWTFGWENLFMVVFKKNKTCILRVKLLNGTLTVSVTCNSHIMRSWKIKFAHKCLVFARVCLMCVFWADFNHIICAEAEFSDIRLCQHHNFGHGEPPATKWCPWWRDCKKSALSALQSETSRMCNCTCTTMVKWMCVYGGGNACVCVFFSQHNAPLQRQTMFHHPTSPLMPPFYTSRR